MSTAAHPGEHGLLGVPRAAPAARHRSRGLRLFGRGLAGLGVLLVFVAALVAGALIHLNTPRARRLVAEEINAAVARSFQGKITVRRIGGIGLTGVTGLDATIADAAGRPLLSLEGLDVRVDTIAAARSALLDRKAPIAVHVSRVGIDSLDVRLDTDDGGKLELLDALAPTRPSTQPDPNAAPGRGVDLVVSEVTLGHAWAHGRMGSAPPLDVDLDGLRASLGYSANALDADLAHARLTVRRIAAGADVAGTLRAHVKKAADAKLPHGSVAWDGTVGAIAHSLRASLVDDRVDAVLDVPGASPEQVRSVWAASPLEQAATAHLEAHGKLDAVHLDLHAGLGRGAFDAKGTVGLEDEKKVDLVLAAHDVDLHELAASAPRTNLGLSGTVSADEKSEGLRGNASIVVEQPGALARVDAKVSPRAGSSVVDFRLMTRVDDFQRVAELGHAVDGRLTLRAGGEVDLGRKAVAAHLEATGTGLARGPNRVQSLSLVAAAHGPLAAPDLDAALLASGIAAGGRRFDSARVTARGAALAPHVTASVRGPDTPDLEASADLGLRGGVSVAGLHAVLARAGERSDITVRDVRLGGGDLRVDGARIEGLGEPLTASVRRTATTTHVQATTRGIDLARVARLAHLEKTLQSGTVALDTDLRLQRTAGEGKLVLDASHVSTSQAKNVTAHVDVAMTGRKVVARVHADLPGIVDLDVDAPEIAFGGSAPLLGAAWKEAFGSVNVRGRADLAKLTTLVPPESLGLSEARGTVVLQGRLARDGVSDVTPAVDLAVGTDQLVLAARVPQERDIDGVLVHPLPAWHLAGVDFDVHAAIDGGTGRIQLTTTARDGRGPLAELDATSAHFPFGDLAHDRSRLTSDLRKTDLELQLVVPERPLEAVPPILQQHHVAGRLQAKVTLAGTIEKPALDVTAALRHGSFSGNVIATPLDVDLAAHYDGARATASVQARARDRKLLDLQAKGQAAIAQLLGPTGSSSGPPWTASLRAHMESFPLESISVLDDKLVSGKLSGDLAIEGLHEDARLDARLAVDALSVGSVHYKGANVVVKADGKVLDADVRIDQPDGFLESKANAVASWGAALAPTLDPSKPLSVSLSSKDFRIAGLLPFVDGVLDELDGRLDADVRAELDPRDKGAKLSGTLSLDRGTLEAAAGGGELHDLAANVKLAPDGTITLEKLTAAGMNGRLEATATAKLQGIKLQHAHAVVTIPGGSPIPLTAGGVELGNVDGRLEVDASAAPDGGGTKLEVQVPQLEVKLPEGSTNSAQALGAMKKVRIGAHRGDPARFVLLPLDPTKKKPPPQDATTQSPPMVIATQLGDIHVVKGTQLKVDLGGKLQVVSGATTKVTGRIALKKGGTLDVQGRTFTIENGTVTFVDDPGDPQVVVKAGWTAPDATVVYATFTGPLKTGKVTLSSEPQLSQEEIVQLLLFGSADGKQAQTPSSSTENSAIATAGGEAAQPLNHMLDQLGLGAVTAKVDTSDSANPKPEIQVQIAKELSLELAYVLGRPPPGVNPDTILLTLDWRMFSKWSLATTVGDAGTTIFDLLWQRRY